jgi:formylglycine-generating enzyme required for sulfatase activity
MNPDGTGQREFYGSGGYWPNGIFYARSIPDHPSKVVGVVTGHHVGRVGELFIIDPARGRQATDGVIQQIPARGRTVAPLIEDRLTMESWPKFLHPYPLSDKHFLVSCKPTPDDLWGIYLVDVFDNMVLIEELEGYALLEPIPFRRRKRPPVIADSIDEDATTALVYMEDVYRGPGLRGVPHGEVKQLRLFTYHFGYQAIAGISHRVGADGPWEPKRVLGTVPVEEDGSAMFRVPANTPISMQPLDGEGKALALMRSWTTAMPGEVVSCVGCHEKQNTTPPNQNTIAAKRRPSKIESWHGPVRGFSFAREVQPVLDKYCVACHNGIQADGHVSPDLRADQGKFVVLKSGNPQPHVVAGKSKNELFKKWNGVFEPSYFELRRLVRVGGLESDIRLLNPGEFDAETSELVQMLKKGHYGVELDDEAWDRLYTWIDLNAPCHGTWRETLGVAKTQRDHGRRIELRKLYAGIDDEDPEAISPRATAPVEPIRPELPPPAEVKVPQVAGWPFGEAEAKRRQMAAGAKVRRTLDLGDGVQIDLVLIPAGRFVMGDPNGCGDERPLSVVEIKKPFWMGRCEVTNEQYGRFDPSHDSRFEHKGSWVFWEHHLGWPLNGPKQPVVRVSHKEAEQFCRWLSEKIGERESLPTEAQWEYACRAGTASPLWYGDVDDDFSAAANMADVTIKQLAYDTDGRHTADLVPRDARFDDNSLVTADVGTYRPNAWGLCDMHGNAWEWTRSAHRPYPYAETDGRNAPQNGDPMVVRGGSWRDRPERCRSAFRLSYPAWQRVYNVGFRIVCETAGGEGHLANRNMP